MVFYFSGTGNSQWAAEEIAARTGDTAYDIIHLESVPEVCGEAQVGFVFPIYAWGVPEPVRNFAKTLAKTNAFTFGICTCGGDAGMAMKRFSKIYPLHSSYSLIMPNNYIIASDTEDKPTILNKIQEAKGQIEIIAQEILARKPVYRVTEGSLAALKSSAANWGFEKFARSTKPFHVTPACIGCGQCAQNCPSGTISMKGNVPVWGEKCYQCLRCIHECPHKAIQYGNSTETKGRYTIWQYLSGKQA